MFSFLFYLLTKNPAYGRHWIFRPTQRVAPQPENQFLLFLGEGAKQKYLFVTKKLLVVKNVYIFINVYIFLGGVGKFSFYFIYFFCSSNWFNFWRVQNYAFWQSWGGKNYCYFFSFIFVITGQYNRSSQQHRIFFDFLVFFRRGEYGYRTTHFNNLMKKTYALIFLDYVI